MRAFPIAIAVMVAGLAAAAQRPTKRPAQPSKAAAAQQQRQSTEAEDKQALEELHQDEIDGNLALDADKIAGTWDSDIVSLPPNAKPLVGIAANQASLAAQQKTLANADILGYEESWDEVRILGDYAYEYGSIHARIRPQGAKDETDIDRNVMRVLKKQPSGAWKVYRLIWNDRTPKTAEKEKP